MGLWAISSDEEGASWYAWRTPELLGFKGASWYVLDHLGSDFPALKLKGFELRDNFYHIRLQIAS
jgi:hypothetical protein